MEEFVRPAESRDTDAIDELAGRWHHTTEQAPRGGRQLAASHPRRSLQQWRELLVDPSWLILVAGIDDVVLGVAVVARTEAHARIELIYVDPDARGIGLGDDLMRAVLDNVRQWDVPEIQAEALPGDRETKNLFERAGLVARLIVVSAPLAP
jgi:GNAT superfamily N-acetyltransferase